MVVRTASSESISPSTVRDEQLRPQKTMIEVFRGLNLPATAKEGDLRRGIGKAFSRKEPLFVAGATGSGKSTCIPALIAAMQDEISALHEGNVRPGMILVTEPRRFVCEVVAGLESHHLGEEVGERVGYQIGRDYANGGERINYVTEGVLIGKIQRDPLLKGVDVLVFDEVHENSVDLHILYGFAKRINSARETYNKTVEVYERIPPLKFVFASATADAVELLDFFAPSTITTELPTSTVTTITPALLKAENIITLEGLSYKVEKSYLKKPLDNGNYFDAAATTIADILQSPAKDDEGDILVFLPGEDEIAETEKRILDELKKRKVDVKDVEIIHLHANTPEEEKEKVLAVGNKRKIILSTNIAETSVTIPNITHVVDTGLIKQNEYDPETGVTELRTVYHSQSGLAQREGRAGRVKNGKYHALYTEAERYKVTDPKIGDIVDRPRMTVPEILRLDVTNLILRMKSLGVQNVRNFDFIKKPESASMEDAIRKLKLLGLMNEKEDLTDTAEFTAKVEVGSANLGRMMYEADKRGCLREVCAISAIMASATRPVFYFPGENKVKSDLQREYKEQGRNLEPTEYEVQGRKTSIRALHDKFKDSDSEFLSILNVWKALEAKITEYNDDPEIRAKMPLNRYISLWCKENYLNYYALKNARREFDKYISKLGNMGKIAEVSALDPTNFEDAVGICATAGFLPNLSRKNSKFDYEPIMSAGKADVKIHPSNKVLSRDPGLIVYSMARLGVMRTRKYGSINVTYAHTCSKVKPIWLKAVLPSDVKESRYEVAPGEHSAARFDIRTQQVVATHGYTLKGFGNDVFLGSDDAPIEGEEAQHIIARALLEGQIKGLPDDIAKKLKELNYDYHNLLVRMVGERPENYV